MAPEYQRRKDDRGWLRYLPAISLVLAILLPLGNQIRSDTRKEEQICSLSKEVTCLKGDYDAYKSQTVDKLTEIAVAVGEIKTELRLKNGK